MFNKGDMVRFKHFPSFYTGSVQKIHYIDLSATYEVLRSSEEDEDGDGCMICGTVRGDPTCGSYWGDKWLELANPYAKEDCL